MLIDIYIKFLEDSLNGFQVIVDMILWQSPRKITKQEDHDGPISLTWANSFAYLLLKFQPSSLL